ncbi:MAG TPA: pentapeptide repeat-containing protein [Pyrinomonadaceae bacterium]
MATDEHLELVKQGVEALNKWKREHTNLVLDLRKADLRYLKLAGADLTGADLSDADLSNADLPGADLTGAILSGANLPGVDLQGATLNGAKALYTTIDNANLSHADLRNATLFRTKFISTDLSNANFSKSLVMHAIFVDVDLSNVLGLEEVKHGGPSEISISTIFISEGGIPEVFLQGCGFPNDVITQLPALVASLRPIQFHSCFISYSSRDEDFARRLHERMRAAGLRVWFAPEDVKGGRKLYEQIDRAIQVHDRLLLVLSESSMRSEWVTTEIRRARKAEVRENRRKLFPIRLMDYDALREWECFDADTGKDLAVEVREYFIPDFSGWKSHDEFEKAFGRLLSDLKAEA